MSRFVNRVLILCGITVAVSAGLTAQVVEQHDHAADGGVVCGSLSFDAEKAWEMVENTARTRPELYQQMLRDAKRTDERRLVAGSDEEFKKTFYVQNQATGRFDEVEAVLKFNGVWSRIWVDVADTGRTVVKNAIKSLAPALDVSTSSKSRNPDKGIVENDIEVFGEPPVNRFEPSSPAQDFLLTDIQDGLSSGFVGGFFSPWDQTNNPGSNQMNLLYIDAKEGLQGSISGLLSTVAHEFQHLIHYRTNPNSQTLYNEGCSEVASILLGYKDRSNSDYLRGTNVPLFTWNYGNGTKLLVDYQRAMTLLYYLYEQYGEPFLTEFVKTRSENIQRITDALTAIGHDPDWQGTLTAYVVANYIGKDFDDSRYIYRNRLSTTVPTPSFSYSDAAEIPASGSAAVEQYASVYTSYSNPGALKVKFKASGPYKVVAILYKSSPTPVEVREMENDREYSFMYNDAEPFDKIVFAIANMANYRQTVSWNVEQLTLGVDDLVADAGDAGLSAIAPNPASGSARVTFRNANTGNVSMQLYDTKGELVRTVVEDRRYEAGEHEVTVNTDDLSNGVYMVRLAQEGKVTSRVLVVLNR